MHENALVQNPCYESGRCQVPWVPKGRRRASLNGADRLTFSKVHASGRRPQRRDIHPLSIQTGLALCSFPKTFGKRRNTDIYKDMNTVD